MEHYIDLDLAKRFLPRMTKADMKQINMPQRTLKRYKKYPENLEDGKIKHVIALTKFIKEHKTNFIGIDLGKYRYLAAANIDRSFAFVNANQTFFMLFRKYKRRMTNQQYDPNIAYTKLKNGLMNHINEVVNKMLSQTEVAFHTVFVVGKCDNKDQIVPSLIFDLTYFAIKERLQAHDSIIIVDESYTSIECPRCQVRDQRNRTNSNHFRCVSCGFSHENDDVVAATNIAKRGKALSI